MAHSSVRRIEREAEEAYEDADYPPDPSLDTALRLAHHAQRLKAMEISLENISHALHAFKADQRRLLRRQTIISLAVGFACLAATGITAAIITHGKHSPAAPAPAQIAAAAPAPATPPAPPVSASPAPAVSALQPAPPQPQMVTVTPPVEAPKPVALGRYEQLPRARATSALENAVTMRLAATAQALPDSWKPIFERETAGDKRAKLQIAAKFLKGEGVKPDPAFAVTLIRQAAEDGNREAMMWLAYSYEAGSFGKPDPAMAARWFQEAAKAGVPTANSELGKLYEKGIDGAPDPETALGWYQRAAAGGDAKAAEAVSRLRRGLMTETVLLATVPAPKPKAAAPAPQQAPMLTPARAGATPVVMRAPAPPQEDNAEAAPQDQPAQTEEAASDPDRMADIRAAQRMLKVLGYKIDKPDGALGPQTQAAIKSWQRDHAAYPDGEFSPELLESLTQEIRFGK